MKSGKNGITRSERNALAEHTRTAVFIVAICLAGGAVTASTAVESVHRPVRETESDTEWMTELYETEETEAIQGAHPESEETESELLGLEETESESSKEEEMESELLEPEETESESSKEEETESEFLEPEETESESSKEEEVESELLEPEESESESSKEEEVESELLEPEEIESESSKEEEVESELLEPEETESESSEQKETEREQTESELPKREEPDGEIPETGLAEAVTEYPESDSEYREESDGESGGLTADQTEKQDETEIEKETEPSAESETESAEETEKKEEILRGIHYELSGDPGAWWCDDSGRIWVREGSSLYAAPLLQKEYNTGASVSGLETDGVFEFLLQKRDDSGAVLKESAAGREAYCVDGEAPAAVFLIDGTAEDGKIYKNQETAVQILLEPDGKSGLYQAQYCMIPCAEDGTWMVRPEECVWNACVNGQTISITEEGTFQIYVKTEDRVGNLAFSASASVCLDQTAPTIAVEGVQDQTANNGTVSVRVLCEDSHYREGSVSISAVGINQGKPIVQQKRTETNEGAEVQYYDVPKERGYDDMYRLIISAEDKAGNQAKRVLEFSVNRFGSVYHLSEETQDQLARYYLSELSDFVLYETNIDYVGDSSVFCRRDGELHVLEAGKDYFISMQGEAHTWKRYCYTIPADYFVEEGIYEILLTSGDEASNISDTASQEKRVVFALDRTEPSCTVSGIEKNRIYEAAEQIMLVTPHDNYGIEQMRIYRNNELFQDVKEAIKQDETQSISLPASDNWQTMQVYVRDHAGNEFWSEQIPVFISQGHREDPKDWKVPEYQPILEYQKTQEYQKMQEAVFEEQETMHQQHAGAAKNETEDADGRTWQISNQEERKEGSYPQTAGREASEKEASEKENSEKGARGLVSDRVSGLIWLAATVLIMLSTAGYMLAARRRKR